MKRGYKATKNFKCESLTYEVGKTYTIDNIKICSHGFHYCVNMMDVLNYYPYDDDFVLLEVEDLGESVSIYDKTCTNILRVVRVVPKEEYEFSYIRYTYDDKGNVISETFLNGDKYLYTYDDKGNKTSMSYANGYKIIWTYDDNGNMTSMTYPNGHKYLYTYDEKGNMIGYEDTLGKKWNITID